MNLQTTRALRLFLLCLSLGALACDLGDVTALLGGSSKPTVVIVSPPSGTQFQEGQDVSVQSNSTDGKGITKVELLVDGAVVNTNLLPQPQPQFTLVQTWKATQGTHTILVRATNTGNATSAPISISVNVAPTIALAGTPSATASPQSAATTSTPTTPTATSTSTTTPTPGCPGPPVIASFTASPSTINAGDSTTLSWGAVTNATSASIDQGIGGIAAPGSKSGVKPATTTKYTLTATGCGGPATKDVTVTVNSVPVSKAQPGKVFFFVPINHYLRYDIAADHVDSGYPLPIIGNWLGWPPAWNFSPTAAVNWGNGKVYFFYFDQYLRYDISVDKVDPGYPQPIIGNFPGWPPSWNGIRGVNWGNGKAYFFFFDQYLRYDIAADKVDPGYPAPLNAANWPGWPPTWNSGIDGVVNWGDCKVYFFKGSQYLKYDIATDKVESGYPQALDAAQWPGWPPSNYTYGGVRWDTKVPKC